MAALRRDDESRFRSVRADALADAEWGLKGSLAASLLLGAPSKVEMTCHIKIRSLNH